MSVSAARTPWTLAFVLSLATPPAPAVGQHAMVERATVVPVPHGPDSNFGRAVDLEGDTLAIGALRQEQAHVFERVREDWVQRATVFADDRFDGDRFGDALVLDGDRLVVGASDQTSPSGVETAGAVYVFERDPTGTWSQVAKLGASDAGPGAGFGVAVAADRDRILVGADWDDEAGDIAGAAYVFRATEAGWEQEQKLLPSVPTFAAHYGMSVALHGKTALIGGNDPPEVFELSLSAGWTSTGKLRPQSAPEPYSRGLALNGARAVVGSPFDGVGGRAWVFDRVSGAWTEQAELVPTDIATGDWFGARVAFDGDRVVVGSPNDDDPVGSAGSAYLFERQEENGRAVWLEAAKLHAVRRLGSGAFGGRVAIEGNTVIVTDYVHGPAGAFSGSAHEFVLPPLGTAFGFGDGSGTPCPCGNEEEAGLERGCRNSRGHGAFLALGGTARTSADDLRVGAFFLPFGTTAWLFCGTERRAGGLGAPFGDGLICVGGRLRRIAPAVELHSSAGWGPGLAGGPDWLPGTTVYLQAWYREPQHMGPCGSAVNWTQAVEVTFGP